MRFVGFVLIAVPVCALAQTAPLPKPPAPGGEHRAAAAAKPGDKKPAPAPAKAAAVKPVHKPPVVAPHPPVVAAPAAPAPVAPAEPTTGSNTGLPLPRFAALRSDDVNFRSGPGTRYPIDWVYKRRDLPVQIEREFEIWRLVQDPQGNKGWVNQATLTARRTAVVAGSEQALREAASDTAAAVARLKAGVILRLRSCDAGSQWCQAQVGDYRGFIRRSEVWGVMPDEVIQ